jgi:hypothetical protein
MSTGEYKETAELLYGSGKPLAGSEDSDEALIELVKTRFPNKPYCLVEDWIIARVEVTEDELKKIHAEGQLPMVVFADNVIFDSQRRFDVGDWVRSTFATSFQDGFLFETRNTMYVLCGNGHEKSVGLKTILSFQL